MWYTHSLRRIILIMASGPIWASVIRVSCSSSSHSFFWAWFGTVPTPWSSSQNRQNRYLSLNWCSLHTERHDPQTQHGGAYSYVFIYKKVTYNTNTNTKLFFITKRDILYSCTGVMEYHGDSVIQTPTPMQQSGSLTYFQATNF